MIMKGGKGEGREGSRMDERGERKDGLGKGKGDGWR